MSLYNYCCFSGVGYGMVIISGIVCVYYNIIITWTIYFLYQSFRAVLPWSTCDNEWNTASCYMRGETGGAGNATNTTGFNATGVLSYAEGNSSVVLLSSTASSVMENVTTAAGEVLQRRTASEEFWQYVYREFCPSFHSVKYALNFFVEGIIIPLFWCDYPSICNLIRGNSPHWFLKVIEFANVS